MPVTSLPRKRKAARSFALTEYGNGERLVDAYGDDLRWVQPLKSWLVWDGTRWRRDDTCTVERWAKATVRDLWRQVAETEDGDFRTALKKFAHQSESIGKVKAMIEHAKSEPGVATRFDVFDRPPMLFNVQNGTLDLTTQTFRPHARTDLLTKRSEVVYDPAATCPRWERFLGEIFDGDQDLIGYVQRALGYTLTGDTREQVLHLMHGVGANGKSTFLDVADALLGDYGTEADFATFLESKNDGGPRNDIARLAGSRMVRSSELGEGKRLNEGVIKALTGNKKISARFLYSESFEFQPTFKLWLAANHKPSIRGTDHAIWRRVRLVPFLVTFAGERKDDTLGTVLLGELSGVLNWCLRGVSDWLEYGLQPPAVVTFFTEQYRTESDVLGHFIEESCRVGATLQVGATDLYNAYKKWAEMGGEYVWSQTVFGRRLDDRGHPSVKSGSGYKLRKGLELLTSTSSTTGGPA